MTAFDALRPGYTVVSTAAKKSLVLTFDGKQAYTIWHVSTDGIWKQLERFFDSSGDHSGALLTWMLSADEILSEVK